MSNSTQVTSPPQPDPTLSTLIPRRSVRRNLLLASAAVALLVGAWLSPHVLRPSVLGDTFGGDSETLVRAHQVVVMVELTPQGWPNVGVQSVSDVGGAKVAGVWVFPGASAERAPTDPAKYTNGLDYLRATWPQKHFDATSQLPQTLDSGRPAQLFILWDILDCSGLVEGQQSQIELTSVLRTSTHQSLPDWSAPGFSIDTLTKSGACLKR